MHWVKECDFRAWVVFPEMGQTEEVGLRRHFGQNVTIARPHGVCRLAQRRRHKAFDGQAIYRRAELRL
jgi:hypothetical protein